MFINLRSINKLFFAFLFTQSFTFTAQATPHKIVCLISPPRCASVSFLRMMDSFGIFEIYHEPSQWACIKTFYPDFCPEKSFLFRESAPETYDDVITQVLASADHRDVFVKEMSFGVSRFIKDRIDFIKNPKVHFIFLIRNPHHSVISLYNRIQSPPDERVTGFKDALEVFNLVKEHSSNKPIIISAEELYSSPDKISKQLCKHLDIPYKDLPSWENLGELFSGENEWHEYKHTSHAQYWHGDAIRSNGFGNLRSYALNLQGEPTFEEIGDHEHREKIKAIYHHELPAYNLLKQLDDYKIESLLETPCSKNLVNSSEETSAKQI